MRSLWIAFAIACSMPPDPIPEPVPEPLEAPAPHEVAEHEDPPPARPTLDPDTTCGRAERCCHAFAEAMPHVVVESACAEPGEVAELEDADARCGRMIEGWRTALDRRDGVDPPEVCASPPRERSPRR
ncbi:MAG: hypothetical protein H6719_31380 [Sandaracinaceae bacterium]|nr:hypothetical protein [Sandaracinaceae bacterium]